MRNASSTCGISCLNAEAFASPELVVKTDHRQNSVLRAADRSIDEPCYPGCCKKHRPIGRRGNRNAVMHLAISDRLSLWPFRKDDAEDLFRCISNWQVAQWLARLPHPYSMADAKAWVADNATPGTIPPFKLCLVRDDRLIGCLLYTSPSPRDATLSRMPSSA